jgi:hypothetical protein
VLVTAGELFEWAWLAAELADRIVYAAETTRFDLTRYFDGMHTRDGIATRLAGIRQRVGTLLLAPDPEWS